MDQAWSSHHLRCEGVDVVMQRINVTKTYFKLECHKRAHQDGLLASSENETVTALTDIKIVFGTLCHGIHLTATVPTTMGKMELICLQTFFFHWMCVALYC